MVSHKGTAFKILFLVLLSMQCYVSGEVRCIERERKALLMFKEGLIDANGGHLSLRWGMTDHECCNWEGVVCGNATRHVVALRLHGLELAGEIKPVLLELHRLNHLDLGDNYFEGRIPEFIGSIKTLQHLNLSFSLFSGTIPPQLGNLTDLRTLDLSKNRLWSENLDWLSSLSQLTLLNLSRSNFNRTDWLKPTVKLRSLQELRLSECTIVSTVVLYPDIFVNASSSSLSVLDLSYTNLTSSAFDWLFNISKSLVKLDLSHNKLDAPIPDAFGGLGSLEYLDLSTNKFKGEIPKSLGNLSHLQILSVSDNDLEGPLEGLIGNVSCQVMVSLEYVVLSYNRFTGPVPDMRACSALRGVSFAQNKLTGSLPLSVGELSLLEILDVSFNSLEGTISEDNLKKLHNLEVLDLSFNSLTVKIASDWSPPFQLEIINFARCNVGPDFPEWIQTQRKKLRGLDLSDANISCEVPKWLWSFSHSLHFINLTSNHISGTIPDLSSTSLSGVLVGSNKFSGHIPLFSRNTILIQLSHNMFSGSISSICTILRLNQFGFLDLSTNQLSGELPNCWEIFTGLEFLNLANNSFSGEIPYSLGSLLSLVSLHLRDNNLSGQMPSSLINFQSLHMLDIGGNKLTGNISWVGANYTSMKYLMLGHNRFYGIIPPDICHLTRLHILDLSNNNFSGKIPDCFNNFTIMGGNNTSDPFWRFYGSFYYYYFPIPVNYNPQWRIESAFVQWKGQEKEYTKTLGLLILIDLSSNRLVGSIPSSFSNLKALISLNLSRNSLTGNIISNIGQMDLLETLDLSQNQLSGVIPTSMAQLTFLSVLDLAMNNLTGPIPLSTQLQNFDASAYAGNNGLCGAPLPVCSNAFIHNQGRNKDVGLSNLQQVFISVFLGFFVGFWGVVASLVLKRSWRITYFNLLDDVGDWLCVTTMILLNKFKGR